MILRSSTWAVVAKVTVPVGTVTVPELEIEEIIGVVKVLFVRV
jgi:hypothetical protein